VGRLDNDAEARRLLRNAVIRARHTLLTDTTDLLALCDDLGGVLKKVDGEWPDLDIEEDDKPVKPPRSLWSGDRRLARNQARRQQRAAQRVKP
jgi:hypothetical protein